MPQRKYDTVPLPEYRLPRGKPSRVYYETSKGRLFRERGWIRNQYDKYILSNPGPVELVIESLRADYKFLETKVTLAVWVLKRLKRLKDLGLVAWR